MKETDKATILDWFQFREVVDDDKFPVFFKRKLNLVYNHYLELLRLEPGMAKYDWFVSDYHETQVNMKGKVKNTTSSTSSNTSNTTNKGNQTTTDGRTITDESRNQGTDTTSVSHGLTVTTDGENHSKDYHNNAAASKTLPQDSSGIVVKREWPISGKDESADTLDLQSLEYATAFQEGSNVDATNNNNHSETKNTGTDTNSVEYGRTTTNTHTTTGDLTVNNDDTVNSTNSGNASMNGSTESENENKSITTGRAGMTPSYIVASAVPVIQSTIAFSWLKEQLEPCFMAIYE